MGSEERCACIYIHKVSRTVLAHAQTCTHVDTHTHIHMHIYTRILNVGSLLSCTFTRAVAEDTCAHVHNTRTHTHINVWYKYHTQVQRVGQHVCKGTEDPRREEKVVLHTHKDTQFAAVK